MRGITLGVLSQGEMFQSYIDRVNSDGGQVKDLSLMYPFVSKLGSLGFSLITVPSAVKAGKLYSMLPSDGSGDFTVSRNGEATYFDKEALFKSAGVNVPIITYTFIEGSFDGLHVSEAKTNLFSTSEGANTDTALYVANTWGIGLEGMCVLNNNNGTRHSTLYSFTGSPDASYTAFYLVRSTTSFVYGTSGHMYFRMGQSSTYSGREITQVFEDLFLVKVMHTLPPIEQWSGTTNGLIGPAVNASGIQGNLEVSAITVLEGLYDDVSLLDYVKTSGSQVTRPADQVSLSDLQGKGFLSSTEGSIFLHKDGDKILDIYQGGNKTTYKNGILQGTVSAPVPTSYLLEPGIYKAIGMKNQTLTAGQAIELTSNGLLP